jgi:hypothetical protein
VLTDEFGLEVDQRTIQRVAMEEWSLFDRGSPRALAPSQKLRLVERDHDHGHLG